MVASELFSSLAAPVFAAMLFIFFLKRRSREINGGEANNNAAANDGTAGGDSGTHTSTEVPEVATSSGANKDDAAANDEIAGSASGTHTSTEVPEMATSSGANKDAAANDGTVGGDSGTHTSTGVPEVTTSSGANKAAAANDGTARGDSGARTSTEVPEMDTSSGYDYEVFLSFRGPDTRSAFTDFLYTSLDGAGIRTFKDDEELRVGEEFAPELLKAINQSKISIPIFSKGYASSVWCLKELVQMVECKKTGGQKIMPIFYDVAPSEVRYQTGDYGEAFRSHKNKNRHDEKVMQEWKDALGVVGALNGWDLHSEEENRREGEFAKKLTGEIFRELKKAYLVVSDCLVSVDNHVDAIMEMIGAKTSETRIVGIHGMGGIGKTTIAKIIYNQLSKNFGGCCFLSNIRETSKLNGIHHLQHRLISDILNTKRVDIRNIDEGIKTIKDRLSNKRVLILLDDVEGQDHMNALVGNRDWFGRGSKLIITTRNKDVLKEVDCTYEVNFMDDHQSLQLFSKHAFRRDSPLDEYIDQSHRAIRIARGLPLTLEVIGSLLSSNNKKMWDAILKMLESVPDDKVQSKLKISYDALNDRQKHIFLDIACIFIGYDKDILVNFWDESKFPEVALEVLQDMSLIKIGESNEVWMHDQLRDLGREMVRQESKMKIEMQSRVWDPKEALDLLRRHEGETKVEALRLHFDHDYEKQYSFTCKDFKRISNLRFLQVNGSEEYFRAEERLLWHESPSNVLPTNVFQENSYLLSHLRWLSWHDIPPTFKIANFSMEDVVILDLSQSKITHDWQGWSHMEGMKNLKVLSLSNCESLERLPNTIGNLESLIELDISSTRIKELPDSIGKLKNLKVVKMECGDIRKIPDALWTIERLEEIHAGMGFFAIKPSCHVNIGNCISINQSVRILRLVGANIYTLQPRLPESLVELQLADLCMDTFPDLSNLTNLKKLDLKFSGRGYDGKSYGPVEDPIPQWMGNLSKLESLRLCFNCEIASPTDLSLPPQLKSLYLWCEITTFPTGLPTQLQSLSLLQHKLRSIPRLPSSLSYLRLEGCNSRRAMEDCDSLCSMEDLSNLKNLSSLDISHAAIAEIPGLGCLENLRDMTLKSLEQVKVLPDLSNLNKLRSLYVWHCSNLVEIQGELPRFLDYLHIGLCPLSNLSDLSSLMGKQVVISHCGKLNVEAILVYARMQPRDLSLEGFDQLQILPDLSNSNELRSLVVRCCHNLVEIQGELPQSLEELKIYSCESLQKLPNLSSLKGLREVCISGCGSLVEIQGELPQSLEKLEISYRKSLQKLLDLSSLKGLRKICISECDSLAEIQGKLPQSLEKLEISCCESLRELPDLSSLMGLRKVCISECGSLAEIQGELPQSLEKLEISYCKSLQELPDLSSLMGLRKVEINRCKKLDVEAISSLCLEKRVEFLEDDESEYEDEGEDNESESKGEDEE